MTRLPLMPTGPPPESSHVALISLTTTCNADCAFCCVRDTLNRPDLNPTDDQLLSTMEASRRRGCTTLSFTGGEPTVHPRFVELCRKGRELGYDAITINTNGIKFKSRAFTERAFEAGLTSVDLSIHGHTAELHDRMMNRPGTFDSVVQATKHLTDLAPRYRATLGSTTVVTTANAPHQLEIADTLLELGIRTLRFKHCFEGAPGAEPGLVGSYAAVVEPLRRAVALARKHGAGIQITHFPLCLLGEEAIFASDLLDENVFSISHNQEVVAQGRASLHRRVQGRPCEGCLLATACTMLDHRYDHASADELRPIRSRGELQRFFARGLARYGQPSRAVAQRIEEIVSQLSEAAPAAVGGEAAPDAKRARSGDSGANASSVVGDEALGFISPSFRVLEINWMEDYEMVKLGVPTFMGHLHRAGLTDIEHWDFDAQICAAMEEDPTSFDLKRYFDGDAVRGFLAGESDTLRAQTEKILDTLGVTEKRIFGISLSAVLDRIAHVKAVAALGQCLTKVLKERYPGCVVVFGGLQAAPTSLHPGLYREFMEACPDIDCCYLQHGDQVGVQMYRNLLSGRPERNAGLHRVIYRGVDESGRPEIRQGVGSDLDPDLQTPGGLATGPGDGPMTPDRLVRRPSAEPHPYDLPDDGDASVIGPQDCDEVPANVPIFDKQLVDEFRYSGLQIMKRFHFDEELMLRFSRFENDRIVVLPHIFVRGCNAPCGFCSYAFTKISGESIAETVAGLKFLSETYDCKHFHFLNTQINSVYRYCDEFCDQVIASGLDILWSDCANMRALDERLLEKMRRAGAMRLVFGVESPEDSMLRYIRKGVKVAKIERLLHASHDLGIWNHVLLIAGMPHETREKQDRMMEFLQRTAPIIDFYSVSSFYLIASSPWGREPHKYGIERISDPERLLEDQAFDEIADGPWESDGLRWAAKKEQIAASTRRFYQTISAAKGQSRCVGGNIDLYMLMFLYSALGHDQKAQIADIYAKTARSIAHVDDDSFRIDIPVIVGRVNEGDQSQLSHVPLVVTVSPREASQRGFCETTRYSFAYRTSPTTTVLPTSTDDWQRSVRRLIGLLTPLLRRIDDAVAPPTPERMAEAVSVSLPRYRPFVDEGFTVVGPASTRGRTVIERNLQWSGVAS